MKIKPGFEGVVANLKRALEQAEREERRLWAMTAVDIIAGPFPSESPKIEDEIAAVRAEMATLKAEMIKHTLSE